MAVVAGLTGGIASGKSTVADLLAERGAVIVDADVLAREVVEPGTPGLARIAERFGPEVITPSGTLDRARLADVVFADPSARAELEAIVHPAVRDRAAQQVAAAVAADPDAVVVQVIPLLAETGQGRDFDCVVVVDAPREVQLERLLARRRGPHDPGLTREQAEARIGAQLDRDARVAVATWVIANGGLRDELAAQVERLWAHLRAHTPHPGWAASRLQ